MKLSKELEAKVLALANQPALPARPKRKPRRVALDRSAAWAVVLVPACRVVTEANTHEFWTARKLRFDVQRAAVRDAWCDSPLPPFAGGMGDFLPLAVTLTHVGPRMDDDNLRGAFKGVRDEVAKMIGVDDGDAQVSWTYEQRPGSPAIEIRIEGRA